MNRGLLLFYADTSFPSNWDSKGSVTLWRRFGGKAPIINPPEAPLFQIVSVRLFMPSE